VRAVFTCAAVLLCIAAAPSLAGAANYLVDTTSDASLQGCAAGGAPDCSLRGAIEKANGVAGADTITFASGLAIVIDTPLPAVTQQLTINAYTSPGTAVIGSGSYDCNAGTYAIDITAAPAQILGLPFRAVCGRAIKSNLADPTIAVGPRRADDTVWITGTAPGAGVVDIFSADSGSDPRDADEFITAPAAPGGSFAYRPPAVPAAGEKFTATGIAADGTSNFALRATTPSDLTSPSLNNAVAISNSRVRLDFSETLGGASGNPAAFALGMANVGRPLVAASAVGNSVFLDSALPWATGEAGAVGMTGTGRVVDPTGNELIGVPTAQVFAGPGELDGPVISGFRLSPNRFCQRATRACKRKTTNVYLTLNKPARVIFKVARGTRKRSELVAFVHRLKAGRNKFKFDAVVSGRTLPATVLTIRAVAQDVARTLSAPVDTPLKIVKKKIDL
jgi:hypothetical protein